MALTQYLHQMANMLINRYYITAAQAAIED